MDLVKLGIFGHGNPLFLKSLELHSKKIVAIPANKGEIRFQIKFIFYFLKNIFIKRSFSKKNLLFAYQKSMIEYYRLDTVLTFLDTQENFYRLANEVTKTRFIAIQNGLRLGSFLKIFEFSNYKTRAQYLCFSPADRSFLQKTSVQFSNILIVGSVLADYHRFATKSFSKQFDICVLSQWRPDLFSDGSGGDYTTEGLPEGFTNLLKNLAEFKKQFHVSIAVAGASHNDIRERKYFESHLGQDIHFYFRDHEPFHSYSLMKKSKVQVGLNSTCLYEAFGQGEKVLFCDYYDYKDQHYPVAGIWPWRLGYDERTSGQFSQKLEILLGLDESEFKRQVADQASFVMTHSKENPAHQTVKEILG